METRYTNVDTPSEYALGFVRVKHTLEHKSEPPKQVEKIVPGFINTSSGIPFGLRTDLGFEPNGDFTFTREVVIALLEKLRGKVLTAVDAAIPPGPQNKATKDIIHGHFEELETSFDEFAEGRGLEPLIDLRYPA